MSSQPLTTSLGISPSGASTLEALHERAIVGVQSAAGYAEGKPLPRSWKDS